MNRNFLRGAVQNNPRIAAVAILNLVDRGGFAEPLLDDALSGSLLTEKHDRGLLTSLVYGVLRWQGFLDWIIAGLYLGDAGRMDAGIRNILRVALFQFFFTERIPSFAIVNEAVKTAKQLFPGRQGLVNAVLRNFLRKKDRIVFPEEVDDPILHLSVVHSHPLWLVKKLADTFGLAETGAICRANNEIPPLTARINRLRSSRDQAAEALRAQGVVVHPTGLSPDGLNLADLPCPIRELAAYKSGLLYIQDEASQLISYLVSPQPAETVLDLCAGTGGKTTQLAELMGNEGKIFAVDIKQDRITELHKTAGRLGIKIITGCASDARAPLPEEIPRLFDRILVDAPCSGSGTLRRNPEIKWRLKGGDIPALTANQLALLSNAADYVKDGGNLVYATCSILPEENEEVVNRFLRLRKDFHLCPPGPAIPAQLIDPGGFFRTSVHRDNTDAFFGAILSKAV